MFAAPTGYVRKSPISSYNQVIRQYNDPINTQNDIKLETAFNTFFYKKWFKIQSSMTIFLLFLYFLPYVNLITLFFNIIFMFIHELALLTLRDNKSKVFDPFRHMIYEPTLCNRTQLNYLYYEIHKEHLKTLKFDPYTEEKIINRSRFFEEHKLRFMVYNGKFIEGFYALIEYRAKVALHMLGNLVIILLMHQFVYYPLLCLQLMSPWRSLQECLQDPYPSSSVYQQ
jgi:hypothetical protein